MRNLRHSLFWLGSVLAVLALGSTLAAAAPAEPGNYLCGGIGLDGRQAMQADRKNYNVHLEFAEAHTGEFISGVKVRIAHLGDKREVGPFEDCGPLLYVQLRPGNYRVSAEYEGRKVAQNITVGSKATDRVMYWR